MLNRIKELRKSNDIKQVVLAKSLGTTQANLSGWENNKWQPDSESIAKMCKIFNCSADYLMGISESKSENMVRNIKKVPIYGTIPAGIPTEMIDESYIDDWEEIDTNSFNPNFDYLGLKVKGDSMYPEFREGDTLILRVQNDCTSGDYCAVSINNTECTFKKVLKQTNGITLQPLNPVYEPVFYSNKEVVEIPIVILGVLVEVRRSYK